MSFIPHTESDIKAMLDEIGVDSINALFTEIPENLLLDTPLDVPSASNELEITQLMHQRAKQDERQLSFLGAGAYEHYIPAAIWQLVARGEFYTAYTPYQAEASQGGLQVIFEYQTMIASLTGMDASNASVYDGATALAEAVLMAVRANKACQSKKVLCVGNLHPLYKETVITITRQQKIELDTLDFCQQSGCIDSTQLPENPDDYAALVIQHPNFFGGLEDIDALTNWAHQHNMLVISTVNPTSLAILKPPGHWGENGADIACGEGQPLGIPLSSGGPYFGFLCCKEKLIRQMPGRIVGRTHDVDGKTGYTLTLQAREQHIRRGKAKSNICTNQGLMVTAATIYMSLMGPEGLKQVALKSHDLCEQLKQRLIEKNIEIVFHAPTFHELVIRIPDCKTTLQQALAQNILLGIALEDYFPSLKDCVLICVTETKTLANLDTLIASMTQ